VSSAWLSAAIQEFEQVTLDNGTELFRVRARAQQGDDPEPRPLLETRAHDGTAELYEPLSSGGDRRGLLRLAYAVPTERVGPSTVFSLRLPDGYRIELPEPTPGDSGTEPEDGQRWEDAEPASEHRDSPEPELRFADGELQRRLAELTAEHEQADVAAARAHEELKSLRGLYGAVEEELRSTRQSVAQALSELDLAHTERDAARRVAESAQAERDAAHQAAESALAERDEARQAAEATRAERDEARQAGEVTRAERDEALQTTREHQTEHARLTTRVRQLQARIELVRADMTGGRSGADPRLRQLESEREQLATHVRALAELLGTDKRSGDAGAELAATVEDNATDRLETIRASVVREANEQAKRELRRLRAGTPL
jgi:chromosome segregation ATPase